MPQDRKEADLHADPQNAIESTLDEIRTRAFADGATPVGVAVVLVTKEKDGSAGLATAFGWLPKPFASLTMLGGIDLLHARIREAQGETVVDAREIGDFPDDLAYPSEANH